MGAAVVGGLYQVEREAKSIMSCLIKYCGARSEVNNTTGCILYNAASNSVCTCTAVYVQYMYVHVHVHSAQCVCTLLANHKVHVQACIARH